VQLEGRHRGQPCARARLVRLLPERSTRIGAPLQIETPPFLAIPIWLGITNTMGGIVIDEHGNRGAPFYWPLRFFFFRPALRMARRASSRSAAAAASSRACSMRLASRSSSSALRAV
jgi:hypothetical protein